MFCRKSRWKENYIVLQINRFVLCKYHLPLKIRTRATRQKRNLKDCILPEFCRMIFYYCNYAGSLQACRWLLSIVMHSRGLFIKFPAGCWYVLKCEIVSEEVLEIPPCDWGHEMNTKFLSFECLKTHQPSYFNFIGWCDEVHVQWFLRNANWLW